MRYLLSIAIVLLLPVSTLAETVAVLSVTYTDYKTASSPKERSDKVKEAVFSAIETVGMTPIDLEERAGDNGSIAECANAICAGDAARKADADIGIVVSVIDKDGEFEIVIHLSTHSSPVTATPFCSFNSMLQRVAGFVESALAEKRQQEDDTGALSEEEDKPDTSDASAPTEETPSPPPLKESPKKRLKPLSPIPFYTMLGLTLAFGGSYAAIESIGFTRSKTIDDKSDLRPLQITSYALLGCTAASGITTIILVFFTDFKSRKDSRQEQASSSPTLYIAPAASPDGYGLTLSGHF